MLPRMFAVPHSTLFHGAIRTKVRWFRGCFDAAVETMLQGYGQVCRRTSAARLLELPGYVDYCLWVLLMTACGVFIHLLCAAVAVRPCRAATSVRCRSAHAVQLLARGLPVHACHARVLQPARASCMHAWCRWLPAGEELHLQPCAVLTVVGSAGKGTMQMLYTDFTDIAVCSKYCLHACATWGRVYTDPTPPLSSPLPAFLPVCNALARAIPPRAPL